MTMVESMRHLRMAETGNLAALRGDHTAALEHYRDAMRIAVDTKAPEVFFRHYLEATLESLELMNAFDNVLEYCDRAIQHYVGHPPQHDVAWLDLATIHQRRGVVLLKDGQSAQARVAFIQALEIADRIGAKLELSRVVTSWLRRGLVVSNERLLSEQKRLRYFSIRKDTPERNEVLSA